MNALMIRLQEEVLRNLTVDWVVFGYQWRDDFVYNYFTEYFYHHNQCVSSIQNSANTLSKIFSYVYKREQDMQYDMVFVMNRYVFHYVHELLIDDPIVTARIIELYRRYHVSKLLPLMIHRYVPMDIYPIVQSYLQESY